MTGFDIPPQDPPRGDALLNAMREHGIPADFAKKLNVDFARQYPDEGLVGATVGTWAGIGVGATNSMLRLGRGAQWLFENASLPGWLLPKAPAIPTDVRSMLSRDSRLRLESRLSQSPIAGAAETVGDVLTILPSGGASVFGKVAQAPGAAIHALSVPGVALGAKLVRKLPEVGKWAQIARGTVPVAIGTGTGFGLYNYMTAEGGLEERSVAAVHGLASGAGLAILGRVAQAAESKILSFTTGASAKGRAKVLRDDIFSGKADPGALLRMDAALVGSAIEATGFAGLDRHWWGDVIRGAQGDEDAMDRAMQVWVGGLAASLLARTGRPGVERTFRREEPDLNTLDTRLLSYEIRNPQQLGWSGPAPKQGPTAPQEPAAEASNRLPGLRVATDPLFKSGWELDPKIESADGRTTLTMQFPGSGKVRMWENEGATGPASEGMGLEVPVDVFRQVRGDVEIISGTENIRMVGKVAQEFLRDLTTLSLLRRIRGELHFGQQGEAWAGGPWRPREGDQEHRFHSIGLDGQHYSSTVFPDDGFRLEPPPTMPIVENGNAQNPQIARWIELMRAMADHTANTPGRDLLEASLALVVGGDPNSRSVQEVTALLSQPWIEGQMNADLAAGFLRPDTIDQFGITVAQVAAGHLTAARASEQIGTSLAGPSKGTQLPAPQGEVLPSPESRSEPAAEGVSAVDIAGSRDWTTAAPKERRDAAAAYVAARPEATVNELRDTFLIPRETARDIATAHTARKMGSNYREGEGVDPAKDNPERGSFDPIEFLTDLARPIGEAAKLAGTIATEGTSKAVESQPRRLARLGGKAGKALSEEIRSASGYKRALIGHAGIEAVKGVKAAKKTSLHEIVTHKNPQGVEYPQLKWILAAQVMAENLTPKEKGAASHVGRALLTLQHAFVDNGGMYAAHDPATGDIVWQRGQKRRVPIVPREYSSNPKNGYYKLMENPADRRAWFNHLANLNPATRKGKPYTGADREAAYLERSSKAVDIDNPEHVAAVEMQRLDRHVPAVFDAPSGRLYQILEPDMAVAMHRIVERQAGRIAAIRQHGQVLPKKVRQMHGLVKEGATGRLEQFNREVENDGTITNKKDVKDLAGRMMDRLQGKEPQPASRLSRAVNEILAVPTAMAVWATGILDIPAVLEVVPYAGWKNLGKALRDAVRNRLSTEEAKRFGSLMHELGNLDAGLSDGPLTKVAEAISTPSNWLEAQKTAVFDRAAKFWLESMAKGTPRADDFDVLTRLLKFSPQDAQQLISGQASPDLVRQARIGLVTTLASKGRIEERSEMAANPSVRAWVKFTGYATKRLEMIATELVQGAKVWGEKGATMGQKARAANRLLHRLMVLGVVGAAGKLLLYLWQGLYEGENGFARLVKEAAEFPGQTIGKAMLGGVAAGPFGMSSSALMEGEPERIGQTVAPLNMLVSMWRAVASGNGPIDVAERMAVAVGAIPREARALLRTMQAAYLGTWEHDSIAKEIQRWKRLAGVEATFSTPTKQSEFYKRMNYVGDLVGASDGNFDKLWGTVEDQIRKALDLQPEEAVAGKLRSMAFLFGLNPTQVDDLQRFVGPDTYKKILRHDEMLNALARRASEERGTEVTPWTEALAMAGRNASFGAANSWGKLMDRAVENAADQKYRGAPVSSSIEELASAIADYPEALAKESSFSDGDREKLADPRRSREYRVRVIDRILTERADARVDAWKRRDSQNRKQR